MIETCRKTLDYFEYARTYLSITHLEFGCLPSVLHIPMPATNDQELVLRAANMSEKHTWEFTYSNFFYESDIANFC